MGRGSYGTSMSTFRVKVRPRPKATKSMCPVCYSVANEPCRKVLNPKDKGTMKRGAVMTNPHRDRPA